METMQSAAAESPSPVEKKGKEEGAYDYVSGLEEQLRALREEKRWLDLHSNQLQAELKQMRKELDEVKNPPLFVATVQEMAGKRAIVRNTNGVEFLVDVKPEFASALAIGMRVGLSQKNLSVVELLPDYRDAHVRAMEVIEKPSVRLEDIGGLESVVRELEEAVILPLTHPQKFKDLGIEAPHGVLLFGRPGVGKTLLAKAMANKSGSTFIGITGSELVRKYIGEGSRLVREVFKLAREKKPAIVFIDEIDAVASQRYNSISGDREVQRTLMQLLAELDGFKERGSVKLIAATNRIDMLDPALLRPGRFDRLIEVPLPDEAGREKIFGIYSAKMALGKDVSLKELAQLAVNTTGADIKSMCMEAGIFALRGGRARISKDDFRLALEKVANQNKPIEAPFNPHGMFV